MLTFGTTDTLLPVASWSLRGFPRPSPCNDITASRNEWQRTEVTVLIAQSFILTIVFPRAFYAWPGRLHAHQRAISVPDMRCKIIPFHGEVSCMRDAPCWSARCSSNTPRPFALNFSCPNDDPRPTFNHYLHCPFNNYSTPLHNFNSTSMRRLPVINCLIDTIFWGHVSPTTSLSQYKETMENLTSPIHFTFVVSNKRRQLTQHLLPSLTGAKSRLHMQDFKNVTHSHSCKTAWTLWSKRKQSQYDRNNFRNWESKLNDVSWLKPVFWQHQTNFSVPQQNSRTF